ncbi:co-chaperone GroES [Fundicoccus culcitae]|uniref:Co-chaperonin GroES n=1 Tax=Fundicoccus culcitae TaxID=2969821 RepID=A0ABY5P4K2_9LACT|nr:co-chaperone GroES [Fundicoccus culcitae]UUX33667.1 co-chaperone GroES [Fundicoccus culcitae]
MLKPLQKRIVIEYPEVEETTASGLVLPSSAKEKKQTGFVVSIGNDIDDEDGIKVGDQVIFEQHAGTEVTYEGKDYLVIDIKHILAVLA